MPNSGKYFRAQEQLIEFDKAIYRGRTAARKVLLMMDAAFGETLMKRALSSCQSTKDLRGRPCSPVPISRQENEILIDHRSTVRLVSLDAELGNEPFNDIFYFCPLELSAQYPSTHFWLTKNLDGKDGKLNLLSSEFFEWEQKC